MGINFGHKRPRLEPLRMPTNLMGYALSRNDIKFENFDEHQVADVVNRQLDRVEARLRKYL